MWVYFMLARVCTTSSPVREREREEGRERVRKIVRKREREREREREYIFLKGMTGALATNLSYLV